MSLVLVSECYWLHRMSYEVFFSSSISGRVCAELVLILFKCLIKFISKAIWARSFLFWGRFLITNSTSLLVIGQFRFSIHSLFSFSCLHPSRSFSILLNLLIFVHMVVHSIRSSPF